MNKVEQNFSVLVIIKGFLNSFCIPKSSFCFHDSRPALYGGVISILASAFIYLEYFELKLTLLYTLLGLLSLWLLLITNRKVWFWSGVGIGLLWFWWIALSFIHYQLSWMIPFVVIGVAFGYGVIFWIIAFLIDKITTILHRYSTKPLEFVTLLLRGVAIVGFGLIHPLGFDWLKLELIFVESYIGIEKWQFVIVLLTLILIHYKRTLIFMPLLLLAVEYDSHIASMLPNEIEIVTTNIPVQEKWTKSHLEVQVETILKEIDDAITKNKQLIILPESAYPDFLNLSPILLTQLQQKANKISIVIGALYADNGTPRNSTYILTPNQLRVANKVVLVPFGESNPLPDFLSDWVNEVFYDGAVDYIASSNITDYKINNTTYRNAICYEATCETLYQGNPKNMIVLSNNGWFVPSVEPTLQRLLLQYYSKKYGTTIYHSTNLSPAYIIANGEYTMVSK